MNTEKDLTRELHDQVDHIDGSPITFDAVVGRAGQIKRRRRITSGVAALAAAAVIVPTAMFGGTLFDNHAAPDPAHPQIQEYGDAVLDPSLPEGDDPPKLAYVDGDHVVTASGQTVQLEHNYATMVRAGDEHVAIRDEPSEAMIDVLDADWNIVESVRAFSPPVSSADGTVAAWMGPDDMVTTRSNGETLEMADVNGESPKTTVAIRGSQTCRESQGPGGCSVFINIQGEAPVAAHSHGNVDMVFDGLTNVNAVSADWLVAGETTDHTDETVPHCSAVFDDEKLKKLFTTCDVVFANNAGFSPDNKLLAGFVPATEGPASAGMTVLDARTGENLIRIELAESVETNTSIVSADWEDNDHLIIKTEKTAGEVRASYNLYRVGLDGSVERLLERDYTGDGGEIQPWMFVQ